MSVQPPSHLSDLPIYKQAMQIFMLSRSISAYLSHDLSYLYEDGTEDANIYFSGDLVQHSESLAPEIINAELEHCHHKRYRHIASVNRLTNRLYRNCSRLESCNSNGKDYLPILKREIRKFRKLQTTWMLTL
ncbi:hypothetical protein [Olleya sp. Bg11-27]|uniref:hypothetical protein n=1 Tax=Olleya sp. Bg11-27 TaxID=2058135 RepID=UPI000C30A845|nr:hypothetical protein [Olleya sp. Bg11-27]AUC77355.1 hypothetical protein CW732_17395 [Olleya sp. Bg11-27]